MDLSTSLEATSVLMPLLETAQKLTGSIEEKLSYLESMKDSITTLLKPLLVDSVPGMIKAAVEHESYIGPLC